MNGLPLIGRELRCEARQPFTYWMRVVAAGIALGVGAVGSFDSLVGGIRPLKGQDVFDVVQPTLFSLIWLMVPILTCDSISRERREGTLGLLLLTLVRPVDVGLAKAWSGILRALTVVLAVLPILTIPFLLGGVSSTELLRAGAMDLMALLAALGAGLLASSRCRVFSRAAVLSLLYAVVALFLLGNLQAVFYIVDQRIATRVSADACWIVVLLGPWVLCAGITDVWRQTGVLPAQGYLWLSAVQVFLAAGFLAWVLFSINRVLPRLATENGRTARQEWWWRVFCTPRLFTQWLRRRQRWLLNRNPIGWLQRRTWSARLSTWSWIGVVALVETCVVSMSLGVSGLRLVRDAQPILAGCVIVGLAFSAADSFRRERETGALELLLVTPLQVRQVILGRLFGLWGQYALVFGLLSGLWLYLGDMRWLGWGGWRRPNDLYELLAQGRIWVLLVFVSSYLLVPVIGMHQSMVRKHFMVSWLVTLALGLIIPFAVPLAVFCVFTVPLLLGGLPWSPDMVSSVRLMAVLAITPQILFAARAAFSLYKNLENRSFALGRE